MHVKDLPQLRLAVLATHLANRTVMLVGDSVMEQFYNALQCFLRREGLEVQVGASYRGAPLTPRWDPLDP